MNSNDSKAQKAASGSLAFTIVELTVSIAVLSLLMVLVLSTVDQTQRIWVRNTAKIAQFQASRDAFEAMTRNLSQATLNTYYEVEFKPGLNPGTQYPVLYYRGADLHYVSGKASQQKLLDGDEDTYPTQGVFFQAPLGVTSDTVNIGGEDVRKYRGLNSLMTAVGYYLKWGPDENVPPPIRDRITERKRVRLMELIQPAEELGVYDMKWYTGQNPDGPDKGFSPSLKSTEWIKKAIGKSTGSTGTEQSQPTSYIHTLAENVVALVFLPKLAEQDREGDKSKLELAPKYEYDTRPPGSNGAPMPQTEVKNLAGFERRQYNQLPPIIQVIMVAVDETSAMRQAGFSEDGPTWTKGLFEKANTERDVEKDLGDPQNPDADSLIGRLANVGGQPGTPKMNYRIYSTDVLIRGAKWSTKD